MRLVIVYVQYLTPVVLVSKSLEVFQHFTTRWSPHLFINMVSFNNIFMYVDRSVSLYLVRKLTEYIFSVVIDQHDVQRCDVIT